MRGVVDATVSIVVGSIQSQWNLSFQYKCYLRTTRNASWTARSTYSHFFLFQFLEASQPPAPLSDVEVADALGLRNRASTPPPFPMLVVAAATGK